MHGHEAPKTSHTIEGLSFLAALRDCLACGIVCLDVQGRISWLSPQAAATLRQDAQAILGQPSDALPAPLARLAQHVCATGEAARRQEVELSVADHETVVVCVTAERLPSAGPQAGVIVLLHDVSSARRLEHNLDRLDRLAGIGTLSAGMAHEIKNALVAIKTFSELVLTQHPDLELADVVRRELRRIDAIVSRMLRFSGPGRLALVPVSMHEVLDHSLRLVEEQMSAKGIRLNRSYQARTDRVRGDDCQLEQVFVNVLLNAVEAMEDGGTLTVSTEWQAPEAALREGAAPPPLRVTIADTGVGIAPENLARLFDPFFTTKPGGTGLGLTITRRILREHGASISVDSAPNRGASFHIALPLLAPA